MQQDIVIKHTSDLPLSRACSLIGICFTFHIGSQRFDSQLPHLGGGDNQPGIEASMGHVAPFPRGPSEQGHWPLGTLVTIPEKKRWSTLGCAGSKLRKC